MVTRLGGGPNTMTTRTGSGDHTSMIIVSWQPRRSTMVTLVTLFGRSGMPGRLADGSLAVTGITGARCNTGVIITGGQPGRSTEMALVALLGSRHVARRLPGRGFTVTGITGARCNIGMLELCRDPASSTVAFITGSRGCDVSRGLAHCLAAVVTYHASARRYCTVVKFRSRPDILVVALVAWLGGLNMIRGFNSRRTLARVSVTLVTPRRCTP